MMATHGALRLARALCTSFPTPRLFRGPPPTQSQRRVASKVHQVLVQTLARGLVRDRWLQDGAAIHILNVQVARGSTLARVLWEPMDDRHDVGKLQQALTRKRGILRRHVTSYLRQKRAVDLQFVPKALLQPAAESAFLDALDRLQREDERTDGDPDDMDTL